jgi:hypothetical protein
MTQFNLSEIAINHEAFSNLVQLQVENKTKFIQSGIISRSQKLDDFCNGCANLFSDVAVKLTRTQQWNEQKLKDSVPDTSSIFTTVADRISAYEMRRLNMVVLSVVQGVFASNGLAPTVDDKHVQNDTTFDASGFDFVPDVTQFTEENFQSARKLVRRPKVLAVHSAVFSRLRKNTLLDFKLDPITGTSSPIYKGLDVVFDDNMPKVGNVYDSYIFGHGALQHGWGTLKNATEVTKVVEGDGLIDVLNRTWAYSIHPAGHTFVGLREKGGPTNNVLAQADSWSRTVDRNKVKMARLRTREA